MNYIMPVIENDYEELNKKAKKLGFQIISNNPGKFLHPDFKSEIFDSKILSILLSKNHLLKGCTPYNQRLPHFL